MPDPPAPPPPLVLPLPTLPAAAAVEVEIGALEATLPPLPAQHVGDDPTPAPHPPPA